MRFLHNMNYDKIPVFDRETIRFLIGLSIGLPLGVVLSLILF